MKEEITLVYIKEFSWNDEDAGMMSAGHLKPGHIYRAIKRENSFGIYISDMKSKHEGVELENLKDSNIRWDCDVEEITQDNILSFDILPEDIPEMQKWQNNEHTDMLHMLTDPEAIKKYNKTTEVVIQSPKEVAKRKRRINGIMNELHDTDKSAYVFMASLIEYFASDDPPIGRLHTNAYADQRKIALSPHGMGFNVGLAIDLLSSYLESQGRSSVFLIRAIESLYYEIKRKGVL